MEKTQTLDLEKNFRVSPIHRGDNFHIVFAEYYYSDSGKKISDWLNDKRHRQKADNLSYRVINHWENMGLLSSDRPSGKGWRKYSIMDRVYIEVVIALRTLGFPLEKIRTLKETLEWPRNEKKPGAFPVLEMMVAHGLVYKYPAHVLVMLDGKGEVVSYDEYTFAIESCALDDHITISLLPILQKLFPDKDLSPEVKHSYTLSDAEFELLWMIRMENCDSITIKAKDGTVTRLDASKPLDVNKRIVDILRGQDYQNIEIKQRQGKVVFMRTTTRKDF
ncbi:MAG: MerR family transcriptional regulator [Bacteroidetes bacterium]|nr:MerR family transcriptional regulator [Bacteroidota bacterium]